MRDEHEAYLDERFSDRVNDIIHDYEHGEFQDWVWQTLCELRDEIHTIEARVRQATGAESWRYDGDLKGLYSAIKAFGDEPKLEGE